MESAATFFAVLAALSTAVQTLVDHVIKKRITWLDTPTRAGGTGLACPGACRYGPRSLGAVPGP